MKWTCSEGEHMLTGGLFVAKVSRLGNAPGYTIMVYGSGYVGGDAGPFETLEDAQQAALKRAAELLRKDMSRVLEQLMGAA